MLIITEAELESRFYFLRWRKILELWTRITVVITTELRELVGGVKNK